MIWAFALIMILALAGIGSWLWVTSDSRKYHTVEVWGCWTKIPEKLPKVVYEEPEFYPDEVDLSNVKIWGQKPIQNKPKGRG